VRTNADVVGRDSKVIQRCVGSVDDCGTKELFHNDTVKLLHTHRSYEDACRRFTYFGSTRPSIIKRLILGLRLSSLTPMEYEASSPESRKITITELGGTKVIRRFRKGLRGLKYFVKLTLVGKKQGFCSQFSCPAISKGLVHRLIL
jgi:hypothetical protein